VRELANNAALESWRDDTIVLVLDESRAQLYSKEREAELERALAAYFGRPLRLTVRIGRPPAETPAQARDRVLAERQETARQAILSDPTVRAIESRFNARVDPDSIRPRAQTHEA
jgi:DNA polymerase-3 subunit gamma/tau